MVLVLFHDMAKIGFFFISTAAASVKNNVFCKSLLLSHTLCQKWCTICSNECEFYFFVQMWLEPDFKNMFMYAIGGGVQAVIGRQ